MKQKLITLIVVTLLMAASIVQAKSKTLLRLNPQKGTTYEMTMVLTSNIDQEATGQKMKIDQKIEMGFSYQVLDFLPNNNFLIVYSMQNVKMNMNLNGKEMDADSNGDASNPFNASFKKLVGDKIKMEINKRGQVERIDGLEGYIKRISLNQQMVQAMQMFSSEKSFKSFIDQTFNYLPENEISKGDKWSSLIKIPALRNMETTMNFEVASIKKGQVDLVITSDVNIDAPIEQNGMKMDVKMTGTQTGTMAIDSKDGWLRSSDLTQNFDVKMNMKNPQTGKDKKIPIHMDLVARITVVKK